jgi:hypothetical protein
MPAAPFRIPAIHTGAPTTPEGDRQNVNDRGSIMNVEIDITNLRFQPELLIR